jgi:hypothetical protein
MLRRLVACILFAVAATGALAAQLRDKAPQEPPAGSGRIAGVVVGAESGRAVRLADVRLSSSAGVFEAVTDEAGGFSFEKLPAGSYSLQTVKPGFLDTVYGQGRPGTDTPGRNITLKDREEITRLVVPISQGGSISGMVRDDRGDPVFQARVRVSRWLMRGGKRTLEEVRSTDTDERGTFRVGLLPSRQYVVSALPSDEVKGNDDARPSQGLAPVFYPSTTSVGGAETIALGVGEHRTNTDLVMPLVKFSKVTGIVVDTSGRPVPEFPVSLVDEQSGMGSEHGTMTEANGRFEFQRIPPGAYVVMAGSRHDDGKVSFEFLRKVDEGAYGISMVSGRIDHKAVRAVVRLDDMLIEEASGRERGPARGSASAEVSVTADVTPDVVLRLDPPREVMGRVSFEGAARRPTTNIEVALRPVLDFGGAHEAKVAADGTFSMNDVLPGRYFVEVRGPGEPWTLASATWASVDTLDFQLEVPRDRDVRELALTFRDVGTELSGAVTSAAGQPVTDRRVVVFPADERLWTTARDRLQSAVLTDIGRFSFENLRPGAYWLAVVADVEPDEWLDPQFLRQLVGASVRITLAEGEEKTQDLRVKDTPR